jgi:3-keto-5-aminohexanoate cleavage enzyme
MKDHQRRKIVVAVAPVGKDDPPVEGNPITPGEVAQTVVECSKAGASMVHLHVRDKTGQQTADLESFSRTVDLIRKQSEIIIQGSTGGLAELSLEERCTAVEEPRVEVASLNMGSANFKETVYINTLPDIRYWARRMHENKVVAELEIFEAGMIPAAFRLIEEGAIKIPYYFNFCLGFHHAMPAEPTSLFFLKSMIPPQSPWGLVHDGMADFVLLATGIGMGASVVRVGFEDSNFFAPGETSTNNAELVKKLCYLIRQMGCDVASPDEARLILNISSH